MMMCKRMKNGKKKGFTLIELIVVIAILAILAAILVPLVSGYTNKARVNTAVSDAKTIVNAVDTFNTDATATSTIAEDTKVSALPVSIVGSTGYVKALPGDIDGNVTVAQLRTFIDSKASGSTGTTPYFNTTNKKVE